MEDRCYAPYPISKFKQLDRIKELTKDSEIISHPGHFTKSEAVKIISKVESVSINAADSNAGKPRKRQRLTPNVLAKENGSTKVMKNDPALEITVKSPEIMSTNDVHKFLNLNHAQDDRDELLQFCVKVLVPSLIHQKMESIPLKQSLISFIEEIPMTAFTLVSGLVNETEYESFVHTVIMKNFLNDNQERTLLENWLNNNTLSGTNQLFDAIASKQSNIYEESYLMEVTTMNMKNNISQQKDKCSKFSKFLLQVITKIPSNLNSSVYNNLIALVDSNKTFLKKRMDQELKRKCSA